MCQPISVIVPVAPGDDAWVELLPQLRLPTGSEIILSIGDHSVDISGRDVADGVKLVGCNKGSGRAGQMNAAAKLASTSLLWFLHADTRLVPETLEKLCEAASLERKALYFFDLKFSGDGPAAMRWNERAAGWRAGFLKIPFGDQGFFVSRELFFELGGYREDLKYGEDHVFVWKARQENVPVERIAAPLFTSARKYQSGGWASVTAKHVWFTIKQGVPQWLELLRRQVIRILS